MSAEVMADYDQIVSALYRARVRQGLTLAQVAERTGGSLQNISIQLRGGQEMRGSALFDLAHALGYDLALIPREAE